jgi:6,7-dimethyl-8-ribityllumazine synthase
MTTIGIVVAEFNGEITFKMKEEAVRAAEEDDAEIGEVISVPGAYDTPLAAKRLASRDEIDCVAVLGAIIEGDTRHDRVIANSTAKTLQEISLETDTPVTLGITGPGMTAREAQDRVEYGYQAAESALELADGND